MNYTAPRPDLYQRITDKIVVELEAGGIGPWMQPWSAVNLGGKVVLPNRHSGEPYRGINTILLWCASLANGYRLPTWMTYKQAKLLGAQVRAGEHGELVVYADRIVKTEMDSKGEEVERAIPFLKAYTVFNVGQIDGLAARFYELPERKLLELPERLIGVETFVRNTGAVVHEGGNRAYYAPGPDRIQMPPLPAFRDRESYYSTLLHECAHWTAPETRCNRVMKFDRKSDEYKIEEVIAEMSSAFLCASLEITAEPRPDHAQYISSWIAGLKADNRLIVRAAAEAQRAADYLHSFQREVPVQPELSPKNGRPGDSEFAPNPAQMRRNPALS